MSMILRPKRWKEFQHYKDRCPPWIKLHRDLLNDRAFMLLPTASKALAPLLWLLASESKSEHGEFDASVDELSFRLRFSEHEITQGLKPLIDKGFFEIASGVLADASNMHTNATPERETEERQRTEREVEVEGEIQASACLSAEPPPPPPKKSPKGSRLPADWFLPKSWGEWVKTERPDLSVEDIKKQADCFRDYWVAVAGAKGVKADWEATWRNWIRRADKKTAVASHGGFASAMDSTRNQILGGGKNGNGFANEIIDITPTGSDCRGIENF